MTSTVASAIRPGLRDNRQQSGSPHTPTRFISSSYSSPGSPFRQEEDAVIIELETRSLSAGFEGESGPQCLIAFGYETSRRVGDYRTWSPGYEKRAGSFEEWTASCELWRGEVKDLDLGLLEDRLERVVREVYNKYLLTDAGNARLVLVLPSLVPHPVLSTILTLLFERWKCPTISLLPRPTMAAVAAGLRSALVVDIGWEETVITPVYEYREMQCYRSTRSMKMLMGKVAQILRIIIEQHQDSDSAPMTFDFNFVEEVFHRIIYCSETAQKDQENPASGTRDTSAYEESQKGQSDTNADEVYIDWPTRSSFRSVKIQHSLLLKAIREALFNSIGDNHFDDDELPLPKLMYQGLLDLSPDVRGVCMSRLVFVGQGSTIPGLKQRLIQELDAIINTRGWSSVRGRHIKAQSNGSPQKSQDRAKVADAKYDIPLPVGKDYVEERLMKQRARNSNGDVQGHLRQVDTLGPWVGASLLTSLKLKGLVEVERDRYLSHGLSGASRETEVSVVPQRTSTFGVGSSKGGDRVSWTLAGWG